LEDRKLYACMYFVVDPVSSELINVNNLFASSPIKELGVHKSYVILELGGLALLVLFATEVMKVQNEFLMKYFNLIYT
jgi:hypothetical protein